MNMPSKERINLYRIFAIYYEFQNPELHNWSRIKSTIISVPKKK